MISVWYGGIILRLKPRSSRIFATSRGQSLAAGNDWGLVIRGRDFYGG